MNPRFSYLLTAVAVATVTFPVRADVLQSADPPITGSASAPVTISFKVVKITPTTGPDETPDPLQGDPFTYTVTGKDVDTWTGSGGTSQLPDPGFACVKLVEDYPTISGPTYRGMSPDYVVTWDFVGLTPLLPDTAKHGTIPARVYKNTYKLKNTANPNGLIDPLEHSVMQTITRTAY